MATHRGPTGVVDLQSTGRPCLRTTSVNRSTYVQIPLTTADPRPDIRLPMLRYRNAPGAMSYLPPHCPDCGGKLVARPMVEGPSHLYECARAGFHFGNRTSVARIGCGSRCMRRPDSRSGFWAGDPPPGPPPFPLPVRSGNPPQRNPWLPFGGFPDHLVLASLPVTPQWCESGVRSIPISGLPDGRVALPGTLPAVLPASDSAAHHHGSRPTISRFQDRFESTPGCSLSSAFTTFPPRHRRQMHMVPRLSRQGLRTVTTPRGWQTAVKTGRHPKVGPSGIAVVAHPGPRLAANRREARARLFNRRTTYPATECFSIPYSHTNSKGIAYHLHCNERTTRTGKVTRQFFFSRDIRPEKAVDALPEGRQVEETATGTLVVKKE